MKNKKILVMIIGCILILWIIAIAIHIGSKYRWYHEYVNSAPLWVYLVPAFFIYGIPVLIGIFTIFILLKKIKTRLYFE